MHEFKHSRPGRSKRRRQQRLMSFFRRYEGVLDLSVPENFRNVHQQWLERRRQKREPMEIGQLLPFMDDVNPEVSQVSMPNGNSVISVPSGLMQRTVSDEFNPV
ncbi:unnamed protein product [Echinostoma caproni]|uniref:Uncharacterized protein n=1 Tax=Echinostoma caproni TaxID=27848 RepID=A0A183AX16_9TREM|nr:unnamed protein product [Echinostoma caproni]